MNKFNEVLARDTKNVPKQVCGFSQTVAFSHYNHLSAQLPLDPANNKVVGGDIKEQTIQVFQNIKNIVEGINHEMDDIVRITIFTKNLDDAIVAKKVYKNFFTDYLPTLTTLIVKNIPMRALVQAEAVLTCGEGTIPKAPQAGDLIKLVSDTKDAPKCKCSSHSVAFSHYNNLTTQYPIDPKTNALVDGGIQAQVRQTLQNIKSILTSIDVPFDDIVKVNIYVKDLKYKKDIKEIYTTFFPDSAIARTIGYFPALSIVQVVDINCEGALVQMDATVSFGDGTPPQEIEDRHGIVIKFKNTNSAPRCAISSQSVAFSHYNHISAQLPIDAATKKIVSEDFEKQVKKCLTNIKNIIKSTKHSIEDVVKLNIFVKDIKKIDLVTKVLKTFFTKKLPAGRIVEVAKIDSKALVQIDAIVANAEGTPPEIK